MTTIAPSSAGERSQNELRPSSFADVIGQARAKDLMTRAIRGAMRRFVPLDHTLMIGPSGTGKTTFANCIANTLGVDIYMLAAPVGIDMLLELRETMQAGDILFVDEIHMQAVRERRGKDSATEPEVWFSLMEDHVLMTGRGPLPFPRVCIIGATTDPGMLPEPFLNRFPLRPQLQLYSDAELRAIAAMNAQKLGLQAEPSALSLLAGASRGIPREINNLMRNAAILGEDDGYLSREEALDVLAVNGITHDGMTKQMQDVLTFLYTRGRRERGDGEVTYQASVNTIATAIGLSRDTRAVSLHVEPYLIRLGYLQVGGGGRMLTDAGIVRARELTDG